MKRSAIGLPAVLLLAVIGCVPMNTECAISQAEQQELVAFGLTPTEVRRMGEHSWVVLSLLRGETISAVQAQSLAHLMAKPGRLGDMPEYPVDLAEGVANIDGRLVGMPSDRPTSAPDPDARPIWRRMVYGPALDLAAVPPEPPYDSPGSSLGPFPYTNASQQYVRGACWKLMSRPGQWRIAAVLTLPDVGKLEDGSTAYVYFRIEAPGAVAAGGLVFGSESPSWHAFLWDGSITDGDGWRQATLSEPLGAGDQVLVVFGLSGSPNGYGLWLWELDNPTALGRYEDYVEPAGSAVEQSNLAIQIACVVSVSGAGARGELSPESELEGLRLRALSTYGWRVSPPQEPALGWEYITDENSFGWSCYPFKAFSVTGAPPDMCVNLRSQPGNGD